MLNILVVDDEPIIKTGIARIVKRCLPDADVHACESAEEAYALIQKTVCQIVFCDISLPGTDGVRLAEKIREIAPSTNIIFTTAYPQYTRPAMEMHASGYILKPVTEEKIRAELQDLRYPLQKTNGDESDEAYTAAQSSGNLKSGKSAAASEKPRIYLRTFGNFEVFCDGKPLQFKYAKTKEMLAYLTDRRGAQVDTRELQAVLWENTSGHESYYKQLRKDLFDTLRQENCLEMIISKRGSIGIWIDFVSCDYYDYLHEDPTAVSLFNGEYMHQYSWAEATLANLLQKTEADERKHS